MNSRSNQIIDCTDDLPVKDIHSLIKELSNQDSLIRNEAHDVLSCIGAPAVPELLSVLQKANTQLRWQIIKIFDNIQDTATIPTLIEHLKDDNVEIRWAASNALINLRRESIPALLEALTRDFDSSRLRQSAHHILRILRDSGKLSKAEDEVYLALEDVQPSSSVPWAAVKALNAIKNQKNNPLQQ